MRLHRKRLSKQLNHKVEQKTYLSLNLKILMHPVPSPHRFEEGEERRFPTCDMFRFRVKSEDGVKVMAKLGNRPDVKELYHKQLGIPPTCDKCKFIFLVLIDGVEVPLEVQILPRERYSSAQKHLRYKSSNYTEQWKAQETREKSKKSAP